jgi:hypothetical protein
VLLQAPLGSQETTRTRSLFVRDVSMKTGAFDGHGNRRRSATAHRDADPTA